MNEQIVIQPPLYFADENLHIWCAQFHPLQNILATTLINGHIQILQYDPQNVKCVAKITDCHKSSARFCHFNSTGTLLATCGEDKRLGFIDASGKIAHRIKKAHENPINRVKFANQQILMSGDDQGVIKVWDLRQSQCVFQVHEQSQTITGLYFDQAYTNIIASSLDGTIAIYDLKQGNDSDNKLYSISDSTDEQLHDIIPMKNGKYLICPSSENSVIIYKRDNIGSFVDRIQGQPGSVDAAVKVDESTFISGCQDGYVRGVGFMPNKVLQVLGQHEEDDLFPIESLSLSYCKNILASTSHDNSIKFYDVSQFVKSRKGVKEEDFDNERQIMAENPIDERQSDILEDESQDYSDDSDQEQLSEKQEKKKKKNNKVSMKERQSQLKKNNQKKFFQGL